MVEADRPRLPQRRVSQRGQASARRARSAGTSPLSGALPAVRLGHGDDDVDRGAGRTGESPGLFGTPAAAAQGHEEGQGTTAWPIDRRRDHVDQAQLGPPHDGHPS